MLFDASRSRLLLINAASCEELIVRSKNWPGDIWCVLIGTLTQLGIGADIAGPCPPALYAGVVARTVVTDALSLWRSGDHAAQLATDGITSLIIAGAWLDEEVAIVALQAMQLGFDVRVLIDVSPLRERRNCELILRRLTASGAICATVRQTLLEAAVSTGDPHILERIRAALGDVSADTALQ